MIPRAVRPLFALLVLLAACKAKKAEFYDKVFTCDPDLANSCGTTQAGDPMVCYSAKTLGGTGFCTETCDPNADSMARSGVVCAAVTVGDPDGGAAASGAVLTECAPSDPAACPERLTCYRTGLTEDKGVCLPMPVCASMADCTQSRPVCAADIIKGAVPPAVRPTLATDHLHCLAFLCKSAGTGCGPGEGCIGSFLNFGSSIDDLCVPTCDVHNACPPNFTCLQDARWAPGASPICFPGMLGTRCAEADDCLMGACTDVGVEFNVCTIPCTSTAQCGALNTDTDVYFCSTKGYCLTPRPFQGSNCATNADCIESQECVGGSVTGEMKHGECRERCDAAGKCRPRGGLPHICLGKDREGQCYPSNFGLPCETQADCLASFKCLPAAPDAHSPQTSYATHICTITCMTDADCDADPWTKKTGFCQDGICRLAGGTGASCDRKAQCVTDRCEVPPGVGAPDGGVVEKKCLDPLRVPETNPQ